ncbi:MAG TPA: hypothetical protein VM490_21840, partial [Armatimonadaceae bacterium]|nr:hypothetical protein [Armatimonadaceae bacterium]
MGGRFLSRADTSPGARRYAYAELRALPGHGYVEAHAINDAGEVVGTTCSNYPGGCRAASWRGVTPTALKGVPGAAGTVATDINASGAIAGRYLVSHPKSPWQMTPMPLFWPGGRRGAPVRLPLPAGANAGEALALNDGGAGGGLRLPDGADRGQRAVAAGCLRTRGVLAGRAGGPPGRAQLRVC